MRTPTKIIIAGVAAVALAAGGDEDSYYEVEVALDDGSQVDVQLDRDFTVVSSEADVETPDSDD